MGADAPEVWHLRGEGGDIVAHELPLGEGIPARIRSGAIQRVTADGEPWTETGEVAAPASFAELSADQERAQRAQDGGAVVGAERPAKSASKGAWEAYAVSAHGLTEAAAEDLSKAELVARFGG